MLLALAALAAPALAGCEKDEPAAEEPTEAPAASSFPAAGGGGLDELLAKTPSADDTVVLPAGQVMAEGRNRFGFGVFSIDGEQIPDAEVAIYAASGADGQATGPFPARVEDLETEAAFTAQTTSGDPDAAKTVYVSDVVVDAPGELRLVAMVRDDEGFAAVRMPSVEVGSADQIPAHGEPAPKVHTPTVEEVGNVQEIDTRVPPDTMHDLDFADVRGKRPAVLLFATPALCTSRVCGPVVDVAEQVKQSYGDKAAFIHMEIYNDNDPSKGVRPQVRAFNLPSEPWLFVIDRNGVVRTAIEGAFGAEELEAAVREVTEG